MYFAHVEDYEILLRRVSVRKSVHTRMAVLLVTAVVASGCASTPTVGRFTNDEKAARFNAELATNYLAADELEEAHTKVLRALEQDSTNALANNTHAKILVALDKPNAAERAFAKSIKLDPHRAEYSNNFGIFLCDQGKTRQAIKQFVKASENKFYRTPEYALDNAGVCAMGAGDLAGADKYFRNAIRKSAVFAPAILHMAELKLKTGDATLADAYYSRFLSLARQTPQSLYVGINIRRQLGDGPAANRFAEQLVKAYPRSSQARTLMASE